MEQLKLSKLEEGARDETAMAVGLCNSDALWKLRCMVDKWETLGHVYSKGEWEEALNDVKSYL